MNKLRLLILGITDFSKDPRIDRQVRGLKDSFQLVTCGVSASSYSTVEHIPFVNCASGVFEKLLMGALILLQRPLIAFWINKKYRAIYENLRNQEHFNLIIANDLEALPIAIRLKEVTGAKVHFDAHEWYEDQFEGSFRYRLKNKWAQSILKICLPKVDCMSTVSPGLVALYEKNYGITPELIYNAPFADKRVQDSPFSNNKIRMVHHGAANPNRGILEMIDFVMQLDERFTLDLVLMKGSPEYFEKIQNAAGKSNRIKLIEPWPLKDIVKNLEAYDIGLFIFEPTTLNLRYTIPNKFFEFIHAGLAVISGPGGEMGPIIEKYNLGINIKDSADHTVKQINAISPNLLNEWKANSKKAAPYFDGLKEMKHLESKLRQIPGLL